MNAVINYHENAADTLLDIADRERILVAEVLRTSGSAMDIADLIGIFSRVTGTTTRWATKRVRDIVSGNCFGQYAWNEHDGVRVYVDWGLWTA